MFSQNVLRYFAIELLGFLRDMFVNVLMAPGAKSDEVFDRVMPQLATKVN